MEAVQGKQRSVSRDMLAANNGLGVVHERRRKRKRSQERRFQPNRPLQPNRKPFSGKLGHEQAACRRHQRCCREVCPSDKKQPSPFRQAVKDEQGADPSEQGQGKQGVVPVEPGLRGAGVDEGGGPEEESEAEQVERRREKGHAWKVYLTEYLRC